MGSDLKKRKILAEKTVVELRRLYPDASCSLDYDDPYFFLVRAILSAQCTDIRVNKTVEELKDIAGSAEEVLKLGEERLGEVIKPCGLYRAKAKNIIKTTSIFINEWNSKIPENIDELVSCPGIGRKIGNLLLGELYGIPALVVDTHFKRVTKRIGLTDSDDPSRVEEDVCEVTDPSVWISLGHMAVAFGRDICVARSPKCGICPLKDFCRGKES